MYYEKLKEKFANRHSHRLRTSAKAKRSNGSWSHLRAFVAGGGDGGDILGPIGFGLVASSFWSEFVRGFRSFGFS